MASLRYQTKGTCSRAINVEVENGIVKSVEFDGGCNGNTQGVARLAEGMEATEIVKRLKGIECRGDNSCPNQLALAVEQNL